MREQGQAMVTCNWCGKRFMDDCGDAFCSSSCEREYEYENRECDGCGNVVGEDNLNAAGLCDDCAEFEGDDE